MHGVTINVYAHALRDFTGAEPWWLTLSPRESAEDVSIAEGWSLYTRSYTRSTAPPGTASARLVTEDSCCGVRLLPLMLAAALLPAWLIIPRMRWRRRARAGRCT